MANNIETAYTHCMFNLDSVHPHTILDLHFEHNGSRSWICSCKLPQPLDFEILDQPVTDSMPIFQVAGEISLVESVPLSDQEEHDEVGNDGVCLACWVEPRPNTASRTLWNHIQQSLDDISEVTGFKLDFSKLYAVDETGMLRLRIAWMPSELNVSAFNPPSTPAYLDHVLCFIFIREPHSPSSMKAIHASSQMSLTGSLYRSCFIWNMAHRQIKELTCRPH
jgi:hypothetical protein